MNRRTAILAAAALCVSAEFGRAAVVDATWIGPASGFVFWEANPANWSNGAVPNNNATTTYNAFVGQNGPATVRHFVDLTLDSINIASSSTVESSRMTIEHATQIDGTLKIYSFGFYTRLMPGVPLSGAGTAVLASGGSISEPARLFCDGGALVIGSGMTVTGAGLVGDSSNPLINNGTLLGGGELIVDCTNLVNNGQFVGGPNQYLAFGGTYTRAQLGTINFTGGPGAFIIKGTLLNEGQVFPIDQTTGSWGLNGTIRGGTVECAPGYSLGVGYMRPGTLDRATVNGSVFISGGTRLYLTDGVLRGNVDVTFGNAPIEGPGEIAHSNFLGPATIEKGAVIRGGPGWYRAFPSAVIQGAINHGKIAPNPFYSVSLNGSPIHDGVISIGRESVVFTGRLDDFGNSTSRLTFNPGGRLEVEVSGNTLRGQLDVASTLDLTTTDDWLDLHLPPDLLPNTYYQIAMTSNGILGQFDHVTPGFDVLYQNNAIYVAAVPEPGGLIGFGCLALSGRKLNRRFRG